MWGRWALEVGALLTVAFVGVIAALGRLFEALPGVLSFAGGVLVVGLTAAAALRGWLGVRRWLARRAPGLPAAAASALGVVAVWLASGPAFHEQLASVRTLVGGRAAAERLTLAHQVYAAYRRSDPAELTRVLERARVYEATVVEAAAVFAVDPEILMGVCAAESAFYPHDSRDGGRGLFQITAPPADAVADARRRLHIEQLDPLNQRHNAFVAAATLRRYLDEMHGDLFLGLLAYNIGPRNGGLRAIMQQYGAHDFATIQPYLTTLPRDYPIRVLSAALAYRLWRTEGRLPRYEDGSNAHHIQSVGIPGLTAATS